MCYEYLKNEVRGVVQQVQGYSVKCLNVSLLLLSSKPQIGTFKL